MPVSSISIQPHQVIKEIYSKNYELYKERRRLELILSSVNEVVFSVNSNFKIILFNKSAENVFEKKYEDVQDKDIRKQLKIIKSNTKKKINLENILFDYKQSYLDELNKNYVSIPTDSGRGRYFKINTAVIDFEDNKRDECVVTLVDITQEVELDRQKDEFISIASHELKTPIAIASTNLWMLNQTVYKKLKGREKRYANDMEEGLKRMQRIINNLLDISRIQSGKFVIDIKDIKMLGIGKEIENSFKILAEKKGLKLKFVSDLDENFLVKADPIRLKECMDNFISNAIKYTEKGLITIEITEEGQFVKFTVKDTGPGISKSEKSNIFSKFGIAREGHKIEKSGASTGLGLYITKQYIKEMRGKIGFESVVGQGTTFWFTVPKA